MKDLLIPNNWMGWCFRLLFIKKISLKLKEAVFGGMPAGTDEVKKAIFWQDIVELL